MPNPQNLTHFLPGHTLNVGRVGRRRKICEMFLESLYEAFNEVDPETGIIKGKDAIRRVRDEEPAKFIACIVGLMPKEITGADGDALKTEIIYRWATPEQQAMPEPDPPPE